MECITLQSLLKPLAHSNDARAGVGELDLQFDDYDELHHGQWASGTVLTVTLEHLQIVSSSNSVQVVTDAEQFHAVRWFAGR